MKVTHVRIFPLPRGQKTLAYCSVTFDDVFVVHDLRLVQGDRGRFLAMPGKKTRGGEIRDLAHPIEQGFRDHIFRLVCEAYDRRGNERVHSATDQDRKTD